jgi:hypothetical protein
MVFGIVYLGLWLVAAWVIKSWAEAWDKPGLPYFVCSLSFTPLMPAFVLLFHGPDQEWVEGHAIAAGKLKRCFRCKEAIRFGAVMCRFCGSAQPSAE